MCFLAVVIFKVIGNVVEWVKHRSLNPGAVGLNPTSDHGGRCLDTDYQYRLSGNGYGK